MKYISYPSSSVILPHLVPNRAAHRPLPAQNKSDNAIKVKESLMEEEEEEEEVCVLLSNPSKFNLTTTYLS
jgi:hypothetical protein